MTKTRVRIPEAFAELLDPPLGSVRYRVYYGGRGSAKSWQFARALLILAYQRPLRVLCAREFQSSIRDSVHHLLSSQIEEIGLEAHYDIQQAVIRGANGSEFIFKGLRRNVAEVKSTEAIDVAWVEEAEAVSDASWRVLIPTVRKPGSEIWVSFNPALETDPTYRRFVESPPDRAIVRKVGYRDNPFLPDVLKRDAEDLRKADPEEYAHVWGGEPWRRSDAQVFADSYVVDEFEPGEKWGGPYFGADWGFSRDPTALVRCWIYDGRLYVDHETGGIGWDADETHRRFVQVPGADEHRIRADNARPETINEMAQRGLNITGAAKWKGSVKDGIAHIRSYDTVVIHPRCKGVASEFLRYSYKVDRRTDEPLPDVEDKHNHYIDAIRYAIQPMIRKRTAPRFRAL